MRTITAFVITFLVLFIFGALWNVVLFGDFYLMNSPSIVKSEDEFSFLPIILGGLLSTGLIVLFSRHYFNQFEGKTFLIGSFLGLVTVALAYLNLYAKLHLSVPYLAMDTIYSCLAFGLGTGVFCWFYFRKSFSTKVAS